VPKSVATRPHTPLPSDNLRVVIEAVTPQVDGGRFSSKSSVGEPLIVEADIFADGHDLVAAEVRYATHGAPDEWATLPMTPLVNDRWQAEIHPAEPGWVRFEITAWIDHFGSWRRGTAAKVRAGQPVSLELEMGAALVDRAREFGRPTGADDAALAQLARALRNGDVLPLDSEPVVALMRKWADRGPVARSPVLTAAVDRERARFSSWYEVFPRSCSPVPGRHGTLQDLADQLPYIADMGFDVVYLPPIHPIGVTHRKGKNNSPTAEPGDVGSPWAIGAAAGGHTAIHPDLGTFDDFDHLVQRARALGMEIALDLAFQCSPDHPWVKEHPTWFRWRPDGTVQFAENPPKRYEDIYPLDFESGDWSDLWQALLDVAWFWIDRGVSIFRVDNPHTKPFRMWEWLIGNVRADRPDVIFLAEAFTRPKVMTQLAKRGFTQSYTYFTWRTSAWELKEYLTELTSAAGRAMVRPNFWPNTPDILPEHLQDAGRGTFMARIVLATTLTANYGIYGPAFELMERTPRAGAEEYVDNEKYELRHWDRDSPDSLAPFIARLNRIRHENPALQYDSTLLFHYCDNEQLLCYSKTPVLEAPDVANPSGPILVVVNLDPHNRQSGFLHLDLDALGIEADTPFQVHDLLSGDRYRWLGASNYVELDPWISPAHVFRVRTRVLSEQDFEYYL